MNDLKHSYSDGIVNKRIVILGPTPPPYGGVSVHIERVIKKLKKQDNKVYVFDTTQIYTSYKRYLFVLFWFIVRIMPDIVYYHTPYGNDYNEINTLYYLYKILNFDLIIIDHDCRYLFQRSDFFKKYYNRLLKVVKHTVFIGNVTYKSYKDNMLCIPKSYSIESAFLPPDISKADEKWQLYPKSLHEFVAAHSPLLAMAVFKFTLVKNKDLYGMDLAIEALEVLKQKYEKVGLVCVVSNDNQSGYFKSIVNQIKTKRLVESVYFLHGNYELWPLFNNVDLFIRPTRSDSYGVSVSEAIYCGTLALASDVCIRDARATLFSIDKGSSKFLYAIHEILGA